MTTIEPTTSASPTSNQTVDAGWHADPFELHRMRYHSGIDWTEHVTHFGPTPCSGCSHSRRN